MLSIIGDLSIPESELTFSASRSGGPGGQNVNKVSSRVTLSFDVFGSAALSAEQKEIVAAKLAPRINKQGILRVVSQRTRSQELNRADAVERFAGLVRLALTPERARIKTSVPHASKATRLDEKKKRTALKQSRSGKDWDQ